MNGVLEMTAVMATQMRLLPLNCTLKMVTVDLMLRMCYIIFF